MLLSLFKAANGNGKQIVLDIIQRYLSGNNNRANINQGFFSRFFS
jgi:predicted ATP-binding protein involved in virulence